MRRRTNLMTIFTQALHHTPSHKTTATQYQNIHFLFSFLFIILFFILLDTTHHKDKLHVYQSPPRQNHRPDTLSTAICILSPFALLFILTFYPYTYGFTPFSEHQHFAHLGQKTAAIMYQAGKIILAPIWFPLFAATALSHFQPMATSNLGQANTNHMGLNTIKKYTTTIAQNAG